MPFCSNCGHEISADAKFCSNCGVLCGSEQSVDPQKRQQEYAGKIIKCPNCGELLSAFQAKCPSCGYEIREAKASTSVSEFAQKLESAKTNDQQVKLIRSFPIPNTKEDIFEFMILASTNVDQDLGKELSSAWKAKIEQACQKAQLILEDSKDLSQFQQMYNQICAKINRDTKMQTVKRAGTLLSELMPVFPNLVIVMGWLISLFILLPMCRVNLDNVGTNAQQLLLIIDLVAGAFLLPHALKCESALPKLVASFGLILSIVVLIPLCGKNLDNVGANVFQLILIVDVVCSVVILIKMLKYKSQDKTASTSHALNGISFIIALLCVLLLLTIYGIGVFMVSINETSRNTPSSNVNVSDGETQGIYIYSIRNYIGKNVASIGEVSGNFQIDKYGSGELNIIFVSEDGMYINPKDEEQKKQYVVVGQNIDAGSDITVVHLRDSKGKPYSNLVDYQSYDEILLYVAPVGTAQSKTEYTAISPTLDRHQYHIRDYIGRNAAAFGENDGSGNRRDTYGAGEIRIVFSSEDGSYVDTGDTNVLRQFIVVNQDIEANTELILEYETDSRGKEYDNLIRSQNFEEINLTLRKIDEAIIVNMPTLELPESSNDANDYKELTIEYKVLRNGDAEITGFKGDGNHATIDSKIDGHPVVSIGNSAFKDCTTLESVLLWADVESIGDYAFAGCTALTGISIPNETTNIGQHAFEGCTALSSLIIWGSPDIGDYAFAGCTNVTSVSISMDTKSIGDHAFDGCTNLTSAIIWDDNTLIGKDAFANCPNLEGRPIQK